MDITYNFISIIDILGIIQGLLFGIMLLLLHSKKNKPTLYLGLFILLFSLEPIPNVLEDLDILKQYPQLELLPIHFHFLAFPLFYIYIQKISVFNSKNPSYWTLIPGCLEVVIGLFIFFLPVSTKLELKTSSYAIIYFIIGLCFTIFIGILTIRWILAHQKEIDNQFSQTLHKKLNWSKLFVYASIGFQVLLILNFFEGNHLLYLIINIINVTLIYWVSFRGIIQENIVSLYLVFPNLDLHFAHLEKNIESTTKPETTPITPKLKQQFMTIKDMSKVLEKVDDYIKNSQCYTKDNLTIIDIVEATNIHPKRISHSLNRQKGINFNNYINKFRIEKAKELFKNNKSNHLSVEGIGMEVGFRSKTTFYNAFKKYEGCTPARYRSL